MFKNITILLSVLSLGFSGSTLAKDLSYSSIQITNMKSNTSANADLLQYGLNVEVINDFFLAGNFTHGDNDFVGFNIGVGKHISVYENTDFTASTSYIRGRYETTESIHFEAINVEVGLRSMVTDTIELSTSIGQIIPASSGDNSSYRQIGAAFNATEILSLRANFATTDPASGTENTLSVSLSLDF